jgi:transglutaminase-like putative cysteine protease
MRYAISHRTRFRYAFPVRFARCNLRLRPIDWDGQRLEEHTLAVDPATPPQPGRPSGYPVETARIVLEKPATELVIDSHAHVVVDRVAPVAEPTDCTVAEAGRLARDVRTLGPVSPANYLYPSPLIAAFPEIADWCARELDPARGVVEAGLALARAIQAGFRYDGSATQLDTSPAEAFAKKRGVCQDFAQIMISGARSAGLATAYVSGYLRTIPPPGRARLVGADATHAWVLIWCGPQRGWIGFDPTNGVTMGPDHIVTAVGRDYADVAPIDGIFLGRDGQKIDVAVDVEPLG